MCLTSSVAQTIIQSVELNSILVPSHRLRIMALLSSGCRATVEGLPNVWRSSTTQGGRATSQIAITQAVLAEFKAFSFLVNWKLFHYSAILYSVFRILQCLINKWLLSPSGYEVSISICNTLSDSKADNTSYTQPITGTNMTEIQYLE